MSAAALMSHLGVVSPECEIVDAQITSSVPNA